MKQTPKVSVLIQLLDSGDVMVQSTSQNRITTLGLLASASALIVQQPKVSESDIVVPGILNV